MNRARHIILKDLSVCCRYPKLIMKIARRNNQIGATGKALVLFCIRLVAPAAQPFRYMEEL